MLYGWSRPRQHQEEELRYLLGKYLIGLRMYVCMHAYIIYALQWFMTISCTLCDAGMSGDPRVADSSGLRQLQVATGEYRARSGGRSLLTPWMKARSGMNLTATTLQPHSSSPIVFPPYRVKKKNTSNWGDDKKAAEKDSVQVSEGFTFDLAERRRTFCWVCERQEVGLGGIVSGQEERSLQWQRFSLFECMCVCAYAALFLFL